MQGINNLKPRRMRSKEDILNERDLIFYGINPDFDTVEGKKAVALEAMDEYAKEVAIEFIKYRDNYRREENRKFRAECERLGGMFTFLGKTDEELLDQFIQDSFTNKNKSPMTREQEPKDVKPEDQGKHPVSVDKPSTPSPNGADGTDSENPTVPRPPLPPQP